MKYLFLIILTCCTLPMQAQGELSWEDFVELVSQEEELIEQEEWTEHLEDLQQYANHPLNINTATRDDLLRLPFLSSVQVDEILNYIDKYYGMKTLFELQLLRSLNAFQRRVLPLFFYAGKVQWQEPEKKRFKDIFKDSHHEFQTRLDIPCYRRQGYLTEDGYRGSSLYNRIKYRYTASNNLQISFHTERDPGEQGIDSYGGQVLLRNIGFLETLIVGDYKLGFGEGLVINQGFSMGKSVLSSYSSRGIRAHTSTDETNFMRGVATTLRLGATTFTAFFSKRRMDATLTDEDEVKTQITSGYHRTGTEYAKKNNFSETLTGAHLGWKKNKFNVGATGYFLRSDKPFNPGTELYRQIYPKGNRFGVTGIDYGYESYHWQMKGETSYDISNHGFATLNTASYRFSSSYQLTASQRHYSRYYHSFFASALSESGVQNETGATVRLDATPFYGLNLTTYADVFFNQWPRYQLTASSQGMEGVVQLNYDIHRNNSLSARYSYKSKCYSSGQQHHHRLKLQWTYEHKLWRYQTSAMLHTLQGSSGFAIGEIIRYGQGSKRPIRFALSGIYFKTKDYNSRVYLYEPSILNTFSIPSFYGHGVRFAGTAQYTFWKRRMNLELKYGVTRYFDRDTQSSGLQTIYSNVKNDISLQLRIKV